MLRPADRGPGEGADREGQVESVGGDRV